MEEKTDLHIYDDIHKYKIHTACVAPKLAIEKNARNDSLIFNRSNIFIKIEYIL